MAITFPTVFQSAIADNAADTAAGHLTPTRYNSGVAPAGLTADCILFSTDATTLAQDSSNLKYKATLINNGPGIQIGSGNGTSSGMQIGQGQSGYGGIYGSAVTPSGLSNCAVYVKADNSSTYINAGTDVQIALGGAPKVKIDGQAGNGMYITPGTITGASQAALSVVRTNNNAAVDTGVVFKFTDTSSAAGFLPFQVLGGASATTNLLKVSKAGVVDAPAYSVAGTPGQSFGPGAVTSITVVNGIITAIS